MDALQRAREDTVRWVEAVPIGLGLCPFAAEPWEQGRVRIAVSSATRPEAVLEALLSELEVLGEADPAELETTLLVHPYALLVFDDYNRFLDVCDAALEHLGLVGTIQVASFHPDYRFEGVAAADAANATNRSPHPMLHLLREESVARAVASHPDTAAIPRRNVERMRALGAEGLARLLAR